MRYYFTLDGKNRKKKANTTVDEDVQKLEPSYTASGIVKWQNHFALFFESWVFGFLSFIAIQLIYNVVLVSW